MTNNQLRALGSGLLGGLALGVFIGHFFGIFALSDGVSWAAFVRAFPWWLPPTMAVLGGIHSVGWLNPGYRAFWKELGRGLLVVVDAIAIMLSFIGWFR